MAVGKPASLRAQGATEYLVVLGVVLIIALVSVSLLGNSLSGTQEAKNSEGAIYWQSATPIAIVDSQADANGVKLRLKNNGAYSLSVLGAVSDGRFSLFSPPISLQPGEEATTDYLTSILNYKQGSGQSSSLLFKNFGIYYSSNVEGHAVAHTQGGITNLVVPCTGECSGTGDDQAGCGPGCTDGMMCCQAPSSQTFQCVLATGGMIFCSDFECQPGYFACYGSCVSIGTACNPCVTDCGVGKFCCQYTALCIDVQEIGSCVDPGPPHP